MQNCGIPRNLVGSPKLSCHGIGSEYPPLSVGQSSGATRSRAIALLIVALLAIPTPGYAQQWAAKMFDHTSHNYGVVARGAKAEHRFSLENLYEEDVHIRQVTSSCGCASMKITKKTLKTYETSEIVVTLNTRKFYGRKDATLKVKLDFEQKNDEGVRTSLPAEVLLHIYSYIRRDVVFEPGSAQFDSVLEGTPATRKIQLSYAGSSDWKIVGYQSENPNLEVQAVETRRQNGQVGYEIQVDLLAGAPAGYLRDHVVLVTNDRREDARQVLLMVEGRVIPAISVSPSPLMLSIVATNQTTTKRLVVSAAEPFQILSVSCPDGRFAFTVPKGSKKVQLIPVTFTSGSTSGRVSEKILIETDFAKHPTLEITASGQVVAPEADMATAEDDSSESDVDEGPSTEVQVGPLLDTP